MKDRQNVLLNGGQEGPKGTRDGGRRGYGGIYILVDQIHGRFVYRMYG